MTQNPEFGVEKSEESKKHLGAGKESRIPRPMLREAISRVSVDCMVMFYCLSWKTGYLHQHPLRISPSPVLSTEVPCIGSDAKEEI